MEASESRFNRQALIAGGKCKSDIAEPPNVTVSIIPMDSLDEKKKKGSAINAKAARTIVSTKATTALATKPA